MRILLLVGLLLCSVFAQAHEPMTHECVAPVRPVNDQDDELWFQFKTRIEEFRSCVNDKMNWHEQAADEHRQAARAVADQWNAFVRTSLNAPEDFPWPPED